MTTYQGYGHRLFDRIQKQPPARKPSHHLGMNGRNQRSQAGVCKLAVRAQFDLAIRSVRASQQSRTGNTTLQTRDAPDSEPLWLMTMAQRYVALRVVELVQGATLRAPRNRAGPQHH